MSVRQEQRKVINLLKRARRLLVTGWIKNISCDFRGKVKCYCATGAVSEAGKQYPTARQEAIKQLALDPWLLRHTTEVTDFSRIINYNDAKQRTKVQILNLFDRTIARVEGSQQ